MKNSEILIDYAMSFLGVHYKWGGNNRLEGLDCSGFIQEILRSVGLDPKGDQTAQDIYNVLCKEDWRSHLDTGSLLFFGESRYEISHIALALNEFLMIEAGGGNSKTKTIEDSIRDNAMVRIRPIKNRGDLVAVIKPNF